MINQNFLLFPQCSPKRVLSQVCENSAGKYLTPKAPFTKIVVDQDQAAQNVQPDLISALSAMLKHNKKGVRNSQSSSSYGRIKISIGFILYFNSLPDDKILDWSKLKQIADDILKCI